MVSFQCDGCADTVKKPKLDQHRQKCFASFTCLDCSTTFRNPSEYKSHTSCVSEAQKYQGALYKGAKKGQNQNASQQPSAVPSPAVELSDLSEPSSSAAATPSATPAIHPSRLNQLSYPEQSFQGGGRGGGSFGRGGRGGRGGYQQQHQQRGGYQGGGYGEKSYASAMNKLQSDGPMRSWGSSPAPTTETNGQGLGGVPSVDEGAKKTKNNKKKGDKGGTGAKANSKRPKNDDDEPSATPVPLSEVVPVEEPKNKKRKFDDEEPEANPATNAPVSSKTVKRLKKRLTKLEERINGEMTLGEWVESLGKDEKKSVDTAEIFKAVKVSFKDGSFQLSL
ncbi:hypothetical protein IAR55_000374 [Kwoniella newhampshirensis]|uniref:Zinc finger C2H2 LYAR-type domain-containing protein n=1 Tax=Kwoniella newhampshirensis TaxID=1651941 RepID=A0AAW0Z6Y4_9TREE